MKVPVKIFLKSKYLIFRGSDGLWCVAVAEAPKEPIREAEVVGKFESRDKARRFLKRKKRPRAEVYG